MIKAILACDGLGGIAKGGVMPWPRNQKDLQHFKKLTQGSTVVMGRRTWEASDMPTPLPGRRNVVVTRDSEYVATGAEIVGDNLTENLTFLAERNTVFIIGGAELFTQVIEQISILHLTRITGSYDCDTFLPFDLIREHFELIDRIMVDQMTTFETYFTRKLYDLSLDTIIR